MNMKLTKGYTFLVLALLVLSAVGILLLNNLGGEWRMQFFWTPVTIGPAVGMLLSAAVGIIVWYTVIGLLPVAIRALREGRKIRRTQSDRDRLKKLENRDGVS